MGEIIELLQGDLQRSELGKPKVEFSEGSVKVTVAASSLVTMSLASDVASFKKDLDLDGISQKRAQIFEKWRKRSTDSQFFSLHVGDHQFKVDKFAQFRHRQKDQWVRVEKYLRGRVVDAGGKTNPNIHLVLPSNQSLKIDATEDQLEGTGILFKTVTLEVTGKEHLGNGELKDLRLLEIYQPKEQVDEAELKKLWRKGSKAWSDVENPNQWVEGLRSS